MSVQGYEIASEVAYDLMQDHLDTILALLDRPMTRDEVVCRLGSETVLQRMVTHGLVKMEEGHLRAASDMYRQLRQEGMMTFLQRYVLPSLAANIQGNCAGMLANRYLRRAPKDLSELRRGRVQALFETLWQISERRAVGNKHRLSILVVGTSRIVPGQSDEAQQALVHLKQACLQRASLAERNDAVLLQFDCLADLDRYVAAERAVQQFIVSLEDERASSPDEASHHLTVASHWRCVDAGGGCVTGTRGDSHVDTRCYNRDSGCDHAAGYCLGRHACRDRRGSRHRGAAQPGRHGWAICWGRAERQRYGGAWA